MKRGFQKGHKIFKGSEKGWFKKGQLSINKGKKIRKDNLCSICKKEEIHHSTHSSYCRNCSNKKQRLWRKNNPEKNKITAKRCQIKVKKTVIEHYGNKCSCCGETIFEFLSLDHINNDGAMHRKIVGTGRKVYYWIIKNNFPKGFQILCFNCNLSKGFSGICPHVGLK